MQRYSWYRTHLCMLINGLRVLLARQPGETGGHFGARGTASVLRICYGDMPRLLRPRTGVHEALRHRSMPAIGQPGWHCVGRLPTLKRHPLS